MGKTEFLASGNQSEISGIKNGNEGGNGALPVSALGRLSKF